MATKLESYGFDRGPYSFDRGRPRKSKYDWDLWLNGDVWRLERGIDFDIPIRSMSSSASNAAVRIGMRVRTKIESDKVLVIQAYKPEPNGGTDV